LRSFAFGISTGCINSVHYLEEQRLLYPAGQFFVSLSADDGKVLVTAAGWPFHRTAALAPGL
jgi:hypothetical protein